MLVEGKVAPVQGADGAFNTFRLSRDASQVVQDGHARYQEAVARGTVFTGWVNQGTPGTVVAANVSPVAAAAAALLALFNPPGSNRNCVVWALAVGSVSGTVPTIPWMLNYANAPNGSATATNASANNGVYNNLLGSAASPVGRVIAQAALTGCPALSHGRPISSVPANGSMTREETAGEIVVPPGAVVALAPGAAGTTYVTAASVVWEEIPL